MIIFADLHDVQYLLRQRFLQSHNNFRGVDSLD